jgi:hypothetical protein
MNEFDLLIPSKSPDPKRCGGVERWRRYDRLRWIWHHPVEDLWIDLPITEVSRENNRG